MQATSFTGYKINYNFLGVSAAKVDTPIKKRVNGYRYAFNGQERDDEIAGEGNSYTAEYWQYDSRLGRRFNLDPVDQVSISNYAAFTNSPILFCDPNGDYSKIGATLRNIFYGRGDKITYTQSTGEWGYMQNNKEGSGTFSDGLSEEKRKEKIDAIILLSIISGLK